MRQLTNGWTHVISAVALSALFLGAACGSKAKPVAAVADVTPADKPPTEQTATEDQTVTVFGDVTMTLPTGWTLSQISDGLYKVMGPDRELVIWLVQKSDVTDDKSALDATWRQVDPDFSLAVQQSVSPPAPQGWERLTQVTYEAPASEQRLTIGVARTLGKKTYLHLIGGPMAAVGRRGAQLQQVLQSFKVPGLAKESFATKTAQPLTGDRLNALDQFLQKAQTTGNVAGVAVAVVADGKIVFSKGYGAEKAGGSAIGPDSLFMIGSTTKALTTLMMARQVDAKRFSWKTPVTQVYPSFALGDPELTSKLTMETTVCACSGMPRQDMEMLFEWRGLTVSHRIAELKDSRPTTGFREVFQYSNPLVSAGGYIAASAAHPGKSIESAYDFEMNAMFAEMGMTSTTFDYDAAQKKSHGRPHGQTFDRGYVPMSVDVERAIEPFRPAGAAWSSANDMARFALIELAKGVTPEGKRIVSEANLLHRRKPQIKIGDDGNYGLGLMVGKEHGVDVVQHGGNTLGFSTDWFVLPGKSVGAVILVNAQSAGMVTSAIRRRLFELWFDGEERAETDFAFSLAQKEKAMARAIKKMTPPTPAWLTELSGTYKNKALGTLTIKSTKEGATIDAGEWSATIATAREPDGSEYVTITSPPLTGLAFEIKRKGKSIALLLKDTQKTYRFTK